MPINLVLRLVLAIVFATLAVIFSDLLPPLPGTNHLLARVLITGLAALLGFAIFPDLTTKVSRLTASLFNLTVARVSSEILNQLLKVPRSALHLPTGSPVPQIGAVTLARPLILDTSSIIDGRILEVAKTSFLSGLILIPNFILLELQQVADSADNLKRARGRRGFEIISELKKVSGVKVEVWDKEVASKSVDEKLLRLAKSLHGKVVTTDFNLNKMAGAHNILVLNVNELSNAVKVQALPGETLELKIVHIGKDPKQGVGYLEDGTMIVVEEGAAFLGKLIKVEVSRVLQGPAGQMIFARKT